MTPPPFPPFPLQIRELRPANAVYPDLLPRPLPPCPQRRPRHRPDRRPASTSAAIRAATSTCASAIRGCRDSATGRSSTMAPPSAIGGWASDCSATSALVGQPARKRELTPRQTGGAPRRLRCASTSCASASDEGQVALHASAADRRCRAFPTTTSEQSRRAMAIVPARLVPVSPVVRDRSPLRSQHVETPSAAGRRAAPARAGRARRSANEDGMTVVGLCCTAQPDGPRAISVRLRFNELVRARTRIGRLQCTVPARAAGTLQAKIDGPARAGASCPEQPHAICPRFPR